MKKIIQKIWKIFSHHFTKIVLFFGILLIIPWGYIMIPSIGNISENSGISRLDSPENSGKTVAIVFGAAAGYGYPSDIFADRLLVAKHLYEEKKIQKILVSGDNKTEDYNEPQAGKKFLLTQGVDPDDIILDYAGFSTHDTCARAKKVFGVKKAYLVTQKFHLPRAIFLCEHFGVESRGVSASLHFYRGKIWNFVRESLAQQKAFYEVFIFSHDPKFLGKEEFIFSEEE